MTDEIVYLLDTNACIKYLNNTDSSVVERIRKELPGAIRLCDVVKAELLYGAYKSSRKEANLELLQRFFALFVSLPFEDRAAHAYGRIRADLEAAGTPIGPYDMQIAAIALANNLVLVTHNTREFSRIAGLALEDWEL